MRLLNEMPYINLISAGHGCDTECPACGNIICAIDFRVENWPMDKDKKRYVAAALEDVIETGGDVPVLCTRCNTLFIYNEETGEVREIPAREFNDLYEIIKRNARYVTNAKPASFMRFYNNQS